VKKKKAVVTTLRQALSYEPVELAFGTSGLRGLVRDITSLEAYVNTKGFLFRLLETGEIARGNTVFVSGDLRPSTGTLVAEEGSRGEILQAVCRAITDSDLAAGYAGRVPTPALALYAMKRGAACVMVTGSHIPFDRNGIKLTKPSGELLKDDEAGILAAARKIRNEEYARPLDGSIFDEQGMLRGQGPLPEEIVEPGQEYAERYAAAFPRDALAGRKILVWQHSAVGRDLVLKILGDLGADAVPAGRSDSFVAVDTEAVNDQMVRDVQALVDAHGGASIAAVVSTDGDSDRPLLLAVDNGKVRFFPGDLLGLVAADYLGAGHVAVPISASDAIELHFGPRHVVVARTKIGSPHVIAAMKEVGWEGNGGFLTAAPVRIPEGGVLEPLPTRDAMLPMLAALCASLGRGKSLGALLDSLPRRFGKTALVRDFSMEAGKEIVTWLSPKDPSILEARFASAGISVRTQEGGERGLAAGDPLAEELAGVRSRLHRYFTSADGFAEVSWINWRDGVRVGFGNNEVAHVRPSGNAPEMRFYSTADTLDRAEFMSTHAVEADGLLDRMRRDSDERSAIAGFRASPRPLTLRPALQNYEWGGYEFIPGLLGMQNVERRPFAELWMGTHPRGPAQAEIDGTFLALDRLIAAEPWQTLGTDVALRFAGRLPYLFKVLDVRIMASLQAHPSKGQAAEGFARENAAGIPLDAPVRNYRDENHKPEVHVVLTNFWMLHGFRPLEEISEALAAESELSGIMPRFDEKLAASRGDPAARSALLRELYARVMSMEQGEVDGILTPLVARLEAAETQGALRKDSHGFWALRAARTFPLPGGHGDKGIISMYLLNLLELKPGQGTYQPAGTLHAYLEGADVELMASSDNVLRGGLTPKHVDVPELLATLSFNDGRPPILEGRAASETGREYETPAEEFALERIEIAPGTPYSGGRDHSADCLIVIEGAAAVIAGGRTVMLPRGGAALVPAALPYSIAARAPRAVLFKAGVPLREDA
jgi:phosphomannomutase